MKTIKLFLVFVTFNFMIYLSFCFVYVTFDINKFSSDSRVSESFIFITTLVIFLVICGYNYTNEKS